MDKRIAITPAEIARAIRVWLRVMPKPIWRALQKYELAALDKRQDPDSAPQVHGAVAQHIADHFERADWEITRPEPKDLGSPPPWSGAGRGGAGRGGFLIESDLAARSIRDRDKR